MIFPRSVRTYDKLHYLLDCLDSMEAGDPGMPNAFRVLFYTPWDKPSKKVKGYDCRVNLEDLPDAYHVMRETLDFAPRMNYSPTLVTFRFQRGQNLLVEVNDNLTAIHHELQARN